MAEEPVQAAEKTPPAEKPISPTGKPLLPPAVVRWLLPLYFVLAGSGFGLLEVLELSDKAMAIYGFAVTALGVLLGVASPGFRRAAPKVGAVILLAFSLSGCRLFNDPCRVLSARQVAVGLRAADGVEARLKASEITPAEAEALLEAHLADVRMGFPSYAECKP